MEYKNTLNLPQTKFPMKADLPKREPELLKLWDRQDIYRLLTEGREQKEKYILHDGPPYANGDIHIGHALNKTLKDIILKYKAMRGFYCPYVPGWDCHGLPIEHRLFKELKINKSQISRLEFRKKAHAYAMKYVLNQKEQFRRLGVFGDWENPYLTLSHEYEEAVISSFYALFEKGYIYRGFKPVNWCYKCETALAEAEVEYEDHASPSVFVKFKLKETDGFGADSYLVIWTTTPWTLIANVAVAVHPQFKYSYIKTEIGNLLVASLLLPSVLSQAGIVRWELIKEIHGSQLEGLVYEHPFKLRKGKVVLAEYVSAEEGSGLVHTAPGHGSDDYLTGLKYNLEIIMPVDSRGRFDATAGEFNGLNVHDANKAIIEKLKVLGVLFFDSIINHSYPHCWRCKSPIIFRATKQWFLKVDHEDLRARMLSVIKDEITWVPASGKERIAAMVELRPDWCLSRQRYWGVPIPALVCVKCKEEFFDGRLIKKFAEFISKEGSDCWLERGLDDFLPDGLECPHCRGKEFIKGADILDVWFDSGVSHQAVLKKRQGLGGTPSALYLEGSDQHRGWFQSSLIPSMAIDSRPPFKAVLTHGHVVDSEGRKMSKSLGNVISPFGIIKDYGADILRMWVASSDYNEDIRISPVILNRLAEAYRKIRNTARFMLSNLYDFNPDKDKAGFGEFRRIDRWILAKMEYILLPSLTDSLNSFQFHKAYKLIYDFCNEDLSMYYLDMIKGRLYTYAAASRERRAAQTVIYEILHALVRVMAPMLVFTSEEIWQHIPKEEKDREVFSVHLLRWPGLSYFKGVALEENTDFKDTQGALALVPDVAKALEEKRSGGEIGSSFDARIILLTNEVKSYKFLTSLEGDLCEILKVSQVEIASVEEIDAGLSVCRGYPEVAIKVIKAEGEKCVRCWNYSLSVGCNNLHSQICDNCLKAIGG
ncbi:MAG: isoleucine--tRNA ligase [Candidatus Omnitrophota bacterium]